MPSTPVTVIKLDFHHQETWRYSATIISQDAHRVELEAFFNRPDTLFHEIWLNQGDRFVETYFTDRWYNIFAIYDRQDGRLKGWYCNISYPAEVSGGVVSFVDLALDLLVYPDGRQLVLDEDEFDALNLPAETQQQARDALAELRQHFKNRLPEQPTPED